MSAIARACLRLSACAALRDATIAGGNVFDSKIEAVNLSDEQPIAGAIAVYTEQDDGDALSVQNGGPPFVPEIDLILEITMQARIVQADGSYVCGSPATDDELEATLDLIETQAELSLFRSYAPNAVLFRLVAKRPRHKGSLRFTDPKGGEKLAIRYVTYRIEIDDQEIPITDGSLSGFDRLPEPFKTIANGWPAGPEKEKATAFADLLGGTTPPAFLDIQTTIHPPLSTMTPGNQPEPARVDTWNLPQ